MKILIARCPVCKVVSAGSWLDPKGDANQSHKEFIADIVLHSALIGREILIVRGGPVTLGKECQCPKENQ